MANNWSCVYCLAEPDEYERTICGECGAIWHEACLDLLRGGLGLNGSEDGCPVCNYNPFDHPAHHPPFHQHEPQQQAQDREDDDDDRVIPIHNDLLLLTNLIDIEGNMALTEAERDRRRQELASGNVNGIPNGDGSEDDEDEDINDREQKLLAAAAAADQALLAVDMALVAAIISDPLDNQYKCSICMRMLDKPVSMPCGHSYCLGCFQYTTGWGAVSLNCPFCGQSTPLQQQKQPKVNLELAQAIRATRMGQPNSMAAIVNGEEQASPRELGRRNGGVTFPTDHFGPILAENDPENNRGILVGDTWGCRILCRQWGAHFPPVCSIAGQKDHGAQSVVLSGGYMDNEDYGEWFLFTGSGGRDFSGNKRTKAQSFHQEFKGVNEALRVSCINGYPVRVIRSYNDKNSAFTPDQGLRYDGIYRVEQCWLIVGPTGFKVCRYLFVRCDNDPAPWSSDVHGDRPMPVPSVDELVRATNVTERNQSPSWDFDEADGRWKWMKPPPKSKRKANSPYSDKGSRKRRMRPAALKRLQKDYGCLICEQVLDMPVMTPCGHNFCKACLEKEFAGVREKNAGGKRALRSQKKNVMMKCPACPNYLSGNLNNFKVNIELKNQIEMLIAESEEHSDNGSLDAEAAHGDDDDEELNAIIKCAKQMEDADDDDQN